MPARQVTDFKKGNEMAALAAKHVNYEVMGYYPITPSTEVAEELDEMKAAGEHEINMIPADGEHGAAGVCYGASLGGGRVVNATSAQGLLYSMEQLPVQSGTRMPMVLNLVTRTVSGPLDIRGDHSDLAFALGVGWIVLLARDPQAVYDMNLIAVKVGEHPDVQLPVIVAYDGFFTSHQKRRVQYFAEAETVRSFLGKRTAPLNALDPEHPVTFGPYMNDPDLINNKYQLHRAMESAAQVIEEVFDSYGELSGRRYRKVEGYRMEEAEVVLVLLNSAADTAKDAVDELREKGEKVGLLTLNVLRPFPLEEVRRALRGARAVVVGDRADVYGSGSGPLAMEIRAALQGDPENRSLVVSRVYGLGGRDFYVDDARHFLELGLETARTGRVERAHDYYGVNPGKPDFRLESPLPPLTAESVSPGIIRFEEHEDHVEVRLPAPRQLTKIPNRIAPGHGACPGCGIFPSLNQFLRGIEGHVVLLFQTGCGMVVTTGYPMTSHRVTYVHNLFQNGAATLSGLVEMYRERSRRGDLPPGEITFVMVSGDGGMDIGMGPAIGTALRGHPMILLEYDNQGYMNTGHQLSYSTPLGSSTSTSHAGAHSFGKTFQHKDTPQIMAATNIPYVFTSVEGLGTDLTKKGAKAQWYVRHGGFVYGKVLSVCPLSWRYEERYGTSVAHGAVDSCLFPVYEVERGKTRINYDPEAKGKKIPVADWLKRLGKAKHLTDPRNAEHLQALQDEVDRRWERLKAKNDHPLL